jgi:ADP-ribose pyrophosphatase YjhB (NUDIX family)
MTWTTLTGAGALVAHDGRVLMIRQRRAYGVHWEVPSGYYEPGESFEEAAAREVLEETSVEVDVGELVCTLVWEREHDQRRNVLAYFAATPVGTPPEPRPQVEEDIEAAVFLDPAKLPSDEIHPLERPILERWWGPRETGFHLVADVHVHPDGTQSYVFR